MAIRVNYNTHLSINLLAHIHKLTHAVEDKVYKCSQSQLLHLFEVFGVNLIQKLSHKPQLSIKILVRLCVRALLAPFACDRYFSIVKFLRNCVIKRLQIGSILVYFPLPHLIVVFNTVPHLAQIDAVDSLHLLLQTRILLFEISPMLHTQHVPYLEEVFFPELFYILIAVFESGLGVLHQPVLSLESAQPVLLVVLAEDILLVELHPPYPLSWIVVEHALYEQPYLFWQLLITRLHFTGGLQVAVVFDVLAVCINLLEHLLRLQEGKRDFAVAFGVEQLVGDYADCPNVHLLVVVVVLGVYFGGIVAESSDF